MPPRADRRGSHPSQTTADRKPSGRPDLCEDRREDARGDVSTGAMLGVSMRGGLCPTSN
jgi:hypothetical protein